ncbi:MAG: hypothetical protein J7M12_03560 [Candidatus Hydrogenedentes bacterium]|nr:hypothetical protein [Candidatus Hydrogenedentota bacterium]
MNRSTVTCIIGATLIAMSIAGPSYAQKTGRNKAGKEEASAVWKTQATFVANTLNLSAAQTAKLVDTYTNVRAEFAKTMAAKRKSAGAGDAKSKSTGRVEVIRQLKKDAATTAIPKLKEALNGVDKDKVKLALAQLGSFSTEWDRMVRVIIGMKLGDKQDKALAATGKYIVAVSAAEQKSSDVKSFRGVQKEYKAKLDEAMKNILSEEQMDKWTKATSTRARHGNQATGKNKGNKGGNKKGHQGGSKSGKNGGSKQL